MLLSVRADHQRLFADLHTVVVDEVHAFGGDDRGWHLLAVLERLSALAGRDLQRIGLSATVGDPDRLLEWLVGASTAPRRVVAPDAGGGATTDVEATIDHVGSVANAAIVISRLHLGEKRLVFCDSRSRVEDLANQLRARQVRTYVSHSSLSADERRQAEEAFAEGTDCVIVATSTLELGIDVGDLDRVIQLNSPNTVASFLQRLGRTGRRAGTTRNTLFLTTGDGLETAKAAGLLHLWSQGYVEPIEPPPYPMHLLAQQLLAYALQEGGIGRHLWPTVVGRLPVFADAIATGVADEIVEHLVATGMLFDDAGMLSVGPEGERSYGYRHFVDLTSSFTAPPLFVVRHGANDIGQIDPTALLNPDRSLATVLLGGHSWAITSIDWRRRVAWVQPTDRKGRSRWIGGGQPWSLELCHAIRDVIGGTNPAGVTLTQRATDQLAATRAEHSWVQPGSTTIVRKADNASWWTWAGQRANATLADALGEYRASSQGDNLSIAVTPDTTTDQVGERVSSLDPANLPRPSVTAAIADGLKFSDCLPEAVAHDVAARRLLDPTAVAAVQAELGLPS